MPLKRTPPNTMSSVTNTQYPTENYLNDSSDTEAQTSKIICSTKRKRGRKEKKQQECDCKFSQSLEEFRKEQQANFNILRSAFEELKEQSIKLRESVEFVAAKYDEAIQKIKQMEEERSNDQKQMILLDIIPDQLERLTRSSSLEIHNVPKQSGETKNDLFNIVANLSKAVSLPIQYHDVYDVFRINGKSQNKSIIVEFTSVLLKEKIEKNIKIFNKEHKNEKLNTGHLQITGPKMPIYVSENLPPRTRRLFFLAREFAAAYKYKYCWSAHGRIFLRKTDGAQFLRVNCEEDIAKLRKKQ
ncbi:unnamed protein product [Parnassius mnemosyne]|uniref:FP protein C-terminal domain-containing protein n=1 Tax=Parnassius mnemosyne TaxID=213953 RepID=A0AAV1M4I3_9NEOP